MKAFRIMLILAFSLLTMQGFSQKKQKKENFLKIKKLYQKHGYGAALDMITHQVCLSDANAKLSPRLLAESYRLIGDSRNAEYWYGEIVNNNNTSTSTDFNPKDILYYAQALQSNGKYAAAKHWFLEYSDAKGNSDAFGKRLAKSCDAALAAASDQGIVIQNMEHLNSKKLDFSPAFWGDGIVFTSSRSRKNKVIKHKDLWLNDNFMDMYFAKVEAGTASSGEAAEFQKVNNKYHDGTAVFSQDGKTMYFARSNSKKRKRKKDKKGITRLKIYQAKKGENGWTDIQELPFNADEFDSCHPALSEDGNVLFFSSNRPGGFGGMDLYRSHRVGLSWSTPENLGATINTEGNEAFPFIHEDGMLYFASNGWSGLGGLDIFRAQEVQDENFKKSWTTPINMGKPLNTKKDDFGLIVGMSGTEGYFTSNRKGGKGMDDIYHVFCQKGIQNMGNPPQKSALVAADLQTTQRQESPSLEQNIVINIPIPERQGSNFDAKHDGYNQGYNQGFNAGFDKGISRTGLENSHPTEYDGRNIHSLKVGEVVEIKNIFYEFDKYSMASIGEKGKAEVTKIANLLKSYPSMKIELASHTDSRGTKAYNKKLSQLRADAIVEYLVKQGIDRNRILAIGYGESVLKNDCKDGVDCPEAAHLRNRRLEFKILEFNPRELDVQYIENAPE